MKSTHWTTVSFLAACTLGAGIFAFAGCTITSGNPTDDGGIVRPNTDGATTSDGSVTTPNDAGGDVVVGSVCTGLKQAEGFSPPKCQLCLEQACCAQLKSCFNATVTGDGGDAGLFDDGNALYKCRTQVEEKFQGDKLREEIELCNAASTPEIVKAYETIQTCGEQNCKTACE